MPGSRSSGRRTAYDLRPGHTLFGTIAASGRLERRIARQRRGGSREPATTGRPRERSKFYLDVSGALADDLDAERQLLLGGDNGLRGYPLRYQAGTSRALLTVEERYYTDWYPFHLFYVGAAAFFDVGRTWGTDVTGAESAGWLRDVGIGLRLGSSRSSFGNVIHIDLAFPLDGDDDIDDVQLLVKTKARFWNAPPRLSYSPQAAAGELGAFDQRAQLQIRDVGIHRAEAGERAETAVAAGDHALAADEVGVAADPLGDQLRMLDVVRRRADHAGNEDLVLGDLLLPEHRPLVRVTRIGALEQQSLRASPAR